MQHHEIWVRGVSFRPEEVAKAARLDPVVFEPEPDNDYDPNAIKVLVIHGTELLHVGYVPKELCTFLKSVVEEMADVHTNPNKRGGYWDAHVGQVICNPDERDFGIQVVFESNTFIPQQEKLKHD